MVLHRVPHDAHPAYYDGGVADSVAVLEHVAHGPLNDANPRPDGDMSQELHPIPVLVKELFARAREHRRNLLVQWKRNYRTLNNRDYRIGSSPWEEEASLPHVWPIIASRVAWLTDQRPSFEVTPTAEAFSPYWDYYNQLASNMNTCIQAAFTNHMIDAEINKALWDVDTYGVGYLKTQWVAHLADGLGDAKPVRVDPFTIYPDPYAKSPDDLSYIIEAKTMTVADADRAWPGAGKLIAMGGFLEDTDEAPHILDDSVRPKAARPLIPGQLGAATGTDARGATLPSNVPGNQSRANSPGRPADSPVITVLECYVRGYSTEKTEHDGVTKVRDDWRCIVVTGNVVLLDEPCSEVSAYPTHPYDRLVAFDTGEWYGPCLVEMLTPIQRLINALTTAVVRNIYLAGNPVLREDPRSASRNKRFTNRPGQRLEGESVDWLQPPQMNPQATGDLIAFLEGKIETVSGLSAMVRGFAPSGRNAQGVLDSVQDAAFVRVRATLRELERTLRGVASKMAANIAEFYTEPRLMSIIGPDGRRTSMSLNARHFYATERGEDGELTGDQIPLRFSLTSDAGSSLPTSKQARSAEAKHLFELGAIDIYELLKAVEWPSYANVAQRVMETQAVQAQAAAMAGQK